MNPTTTVLIKEPTTIICKKFIDGTINIIPQLHYDRIFKAAIVGIMKDRRLHELDPIVISYGNVLKSNPLLMVQRYLRYSEYKKGAAKRIYASNKLSKIELQEAYVQNKALKLEQYYNSINKFFVCSIDYEGQNLEIYNLIDNVLKHPSLTCFYTNPTTHIIYYFKNMFDVIPNEDITNLFILHQSKNLNNLD